MVDPTEAQRARLSAAGVAANKVRSLSDAFKREGLPPAAFDVLVAGVVALVDFEQNGKAKIKTERERLDSMAAVELAATTLRSAIEDLQNGDFMRLDLHLWDDPDFPHAQDADLLGKVVSAQRLADQIAAAARACRAGIERDGNGGKGRKQTLPMYAGHIAVMAHQLMPFGLIPGDGGPFRRLCDAVFQAAGVGATAQGSIVYFKKEMRTEYRARGLCL